ncbi:hypothetical protein NQZ68_042206, partial [Dissostichus eleginoides]
MVWSEWTPCPAPREKDTPQTEHYSLLSHVGLLPPTEPGTESMTSASNTWKPPCHTSTNPG